MGVVGSSGGNLRASGRQIGRRCSDSVFLLQARERPELAPSSGVGFEQTEDVNHSRGAQTTFDRALDVAEREGWVAKMRPAQGLLEEDDLVEVAFEEGAIEAVDIRVRYVPERIAEALVERSREALSGEIRRRRTS